MAETRLFAPVIRAVQPAFVYNKDTKGEVKIYFSFSAYNKIDEITHIRYTLIDPNQASTWGNNSMIIDKDYLEISTDNLVREKEGNEYYFSISEEDFKKFIKDLNTNQFYQMQIYLVKIEEINEDGETIIKENISESSQITLIRPIDEAELIISTFNSSNLNDEEDIYVLNSFLKLEGYLSYIYSQSTVETINTYNFKILDSYGRVFYSSPKITNLLGVKFSINIGLNFKENEKYTLIFQYETKHGYKSQTFEREFKISSTTLSDTLPLIITEGFPKTDSSCGGIRFNFKINFDENTIDRGEGSEIIIQRTSELVNYLNWETIAKIKVDFFNYFDKIDWIDTFVQGNTNYKYRFIFADKYIYTYEKTVLAEFEDIFLGDNDFMLSIKYNPNITNFKWITQDSITNTLGSKFPVARRNGDTYYRQFNISGTLFLEAKKDDIQLGVIDSWDTNQNYLPEVVDWFTEEERSLFLSQNMTYEYKNNTSRLRILERRPLDVAMQFLTNGKPKLFRSPTEDNMIVFLSNISFTPNKTLGREVYDFTAIATEICENTEENLIYYGFDSKIDYLYVLILNSLRTIETKENTGIFSAVIRPNELINNSSIKLLLLEDLV